MLIDGLGEKVEPGGWTVWFDDGESGCFGHFPLDEPMREIAWENVDFCGNCGGCNRGAGTCKMIFGKEFDSVCVTLMKFDNPNVEAVECMKRLSEIRRDYIFGNG